MEFIILSILSWVIWVALRAKEPGYHRDRWGRLSRSQKDLRKGGWI